MCALACVRAWAAILDGPSPTGARRRYGRAQACRRLLAAFLPPSLACGAERTAEGKRGGLDTRDETHVVCLITLRASCICVYTRTETLSLVSSRYEPCVYACIHTHRHVVCLITL